MSRCWTLHDVIGTTALQTKKKTVVKEINQKCIHDDYDVTMKMIATFVHSKGFLQL
jgi:hypothetical protein